MLKKYDDSEDRNMNNKRSFSKGKKNPGGLLRVFRYMVNVPVVH